MRAWINGHTADTAEGRLAKKSGLLVSGADCTADDGSGGILGGLGGGGECDEGTETPGTTGIDGEPDYTDVVSVEWVNFTDGHLNCDDHKPSDGTDVEYNNGAVGDRAEIYTCTLTTLAGVPIQGAYIDAEIISGTNKDLRAAKADYNDVCALPTDANGRCNTGGTISMPVDGASIICFWAEPAKQKTSQNEPDEGADDKYTSPGSNTDGGGCNAEPVDEPENNDISDEVYLDTGAPRAEGLDVSAGEHHRVRRQPVQPPRRRLRPVRCAVQGQYRTAGQALRRVGSRPERRQHGDVG